MLHICNNNQNNYDNQLKIIKVITNHQKIQIMTAQRQRCKKYTHYHDTYRKELGLMHDESHS